LVSSGFYLVYYFFDYDLTKKFTDEQYNDSLELDGEKDFLQIYEKLYKSGFLSNLICMG